MTLLYTESIDAFTNVPFTQVLGWSKEQPEAFNDEVRRDALNWEVHAMHY